MRKILVPALFTLTLAAAPAQAAGKDVSRHTKPGSPIATAVEVPAGKNLVFLSGVVPPIADPKADKNSAAAYGDTRTQTLGALQTIEANLKELGLGMKDVVKMTVFLAGDPAQGGKMDFAGMMDAYKQYFGTPAQPNLPARSTVQVAQLVNPLYLIEVEVIAARP